MLYDDNGRLLTRAIFWELSFPERRAKFPPLYTLGVVPAHGLPSAYQIYMSCVDEYEAGIKLMGNMKAWRQLCSCDWFMNGDPRTGHEGLVQWRKDMEARDKSIAKQQLKVRAEKGSVPAMVKLYNITPAQAKAVKKKVQENPQDNKVVDILKRMRE